VDAICRFKDLTWLVTHSKQLDDQEARRLFHWLPKLQTLRLQEAKMTGDALADLPECKDLQILDLDHSRVTDNGLRHLLRLPDLREVRLFNTQVTDDGLEHLGRLPHLALLQLHGTGVTDDGLAHLAGLTALEDLGLGDTVITDAGLKHLAGMSNLHTLGVDGTRITDNGLKHLSECSTLTRLWLFNTAVTDAGLEHLRKFPRLTFLYLDKPGVTDAGLKHLIVIRSLQELSLTDTAVTPDGLRRLKASLPGCKITPEPPPAGGGQPSGGSAAENVRRGNVPTPPSYRNHKPGLIWSTPPGTSWWWCACFSPRGDSVAASEDPHPRVDASSVVIRVWPITNKQTGNDSLVMRHPTTSKTWLTGMQFAPDGKRLASATQEGSICVWDMDTSKPVLLSRVQRFDDVVTGLAFSSDGQYLAAGARKEGSPVRVWELSDPTRPNELYSFRPTKHDQISAVVFSPDSQVLYVGAGKKNSGANVYAWSYRKATTAPILWSRADTEIGPWPRTLAVSRDGSQLGLAHGDKAYIIDSRTGAVHVQLDHHSGKSVIGIQFAADGSRCVTSGYDQSIRAWSTSDGAQLWKNDETTGANEGVGISPDGRLAFTSSHLGDDRIQGNVGQLWRLPEPAQASPGRVAAEWALGIGGEVQVEVAGKRTTAKSATDLPAAEFRLVAVHLANNGRVTDDGLTALARAKDLESLNPNGTGITSRGVARLGSLAGLKYLNLCVPALRDADLAVINDLPALYALEISYTPIGDAGLEHLKGCANLHTLYVTQTQVTERGVAALKAARPGCEIVR
jgi:hypothetical protein